MTVRDMTEPARTSRPRARCVHPPTTAGGAIRSATLWLLFLFAWLTGAPAPLHPASPVRGNASVHAPHLVESVVADDPCAEAEEADDAPGDDPEDDGAAPPQAQTTAHALLARTARRAADLRPGQGRHAAFRSDGAWPQRATPTRGPPNAQG